MPGVPEHASRVRDGGASRLPTIGAATASVLLHAAPLAVLLLLPSASIYGVSSKPSEDVSLETLVTVDVEVVDSIETIKPPAAAIDQTAVPATPGSHKATASRGDLLAYAGLIRGRLAKRKPKTRGHVGTVVVAFGIAPSGSVSFATIERKSGVPVLDEAALKAVREAGPFPPTPDGRDHAFVLPFEFR